MEKSLTSSYNKRYSFQTLFSHSKSTRYILLFVILSLCIISFSLIIPSSNFILNFIKGLQIAAFLSLGLLHAVLIEKELSFAGPSFSHKLLFSLVLGFAICCTLLVFNFLTDTGMTRLAFSGTCGFLLPFTVTQSWNFFVSIPPKRSKVWSDYKAVPEKAAIVYLNIIRISFNLTRSRLHKEEQLYLVDAPLQMELGKLFNLFLHVKNKNQVVEIECIDEESYPYGWKFSVKTLGGLKKRYLNPTLSLSDNRNIKKNTIITANRVKINKKKYQINNPELN